MRRAAAFAVPVFVLAAGCSSAATTTSTVNQAPAATTSAPGAPAAATSAAPPAAKKAGVGSAIDINGQNAGNVLEVTLVKIVDPAKSDNEAFTPDAGKRYIGIQFKLVNKGHGEYDDDPQIDVKVIDAAGESFEAELGTTITAGQALDSGLKLPAGDTALGYLVFQLPNGVKAAKVQYTLNAFGNTGEWTVG